MYHLGVDIGTTYTAAAVWRAGRADIVTLADRTAVVPSVLFLRDDGELLFGEAAERRARIDPRRVARGVKRRVGDPTPLVVANSPFAADALMGKLLRWVVDSVSEREGGPPEGIAVTHPANWGGYKRDQLARHRSRP
jgi:molecular chaperone DnaK (HSP70)